MLTYRSMLRFSLPRDASYLARSDTPLRRAVSFLLFAGDTVVFGEWRSDARGVGFPAAWHRKWASKVCMMNRKTNKYGF